MRCAKLNFMNERVHTNIRCIDVTIGNGTNWTTGIRFAIMFPGVNSPSLKSSRLPLMKNERISTKSEIFDFIERL